MTDEGALAALRRKLRALAAVARDAAATPPERANAAALKKQLEERLREAGAIILAKANLGEMGTPNSRSSFGGPFCNPYDTQRSPGTSSGSSSRS